MISIYGHSGSQNHGNEAIVRGVCQLFEKHNQSINQSINLYSYSPSVDKQFELDKVCNVLPFFKEYKRYSLEHIKHYLRRKIFKNRHKNDPWFMKRYLLNNFFTNINGVYLLEAGDQYCENNSYRRFLGYLNRAITQRGGKTVLMGCTINKDILADGEIIEDIKRYSLIIARESITYDALIDAGIKRNIYLAPCPAFLMEAEKCKLDSIFCEKEEVVGINLGFLAQGNEKYYDLMVENTVELIKWIMLNTKFNVALIPHVNWSYEGSDYCTLKKVYDIFEKDYSERIQICSEKSANQQKYVMSHCKFIVTLRTHVAIPSIASQVPTLVTGYKQKSEGIVKDIFPENFKVLADVTSLKTNKDYIEHFKWMLENEDLIRKYMAENIPAYIEKTKMIKELVLNLEKKN